MSDEGKLPDLKDESEKVEGAVAAENGGKPKRKDLLSSDPQLSAGLLMLRLQLAGAKLQG